MELVLNPMAIPCFKGQGTHQSGNDSTGMQRPIPKRSRLNLECYGDFSNHLMGSCFICAPMMMIKHSILIDVGMFEEQHTHLMENWELAIRLSQVAIFAFSQRTLHIAYDGNDNVIDKASTVYFKRDC
ncbi:MAG: GT2 family glycosyltransferase [Planctomycetota bacterium]|jgi:GT2 family glycosyltransferase